MKLTEKDIRRILYVYRKKGNCLRILCSDCIFHVYGESCFPVIAYNKARIVIENNPELFMEYLL